MLDMFFHICDPDTDELAFPVHGLPAKHYLGSFVIVEPETEPDVHALYYIRIFKNGPKPYTGLRDVNNLRTPHKAVFCDKNTRQVSLLAIMTPGFEPDMERPVAFLASDLVVPGEVHATHIEGFRFPAFLACDVTEMAVGQIDDFLCAHR